MERVSRTAAVLLALVLLTTVASAQKLPEIRFEKYELSNGLDVILYEDHAMPTATVNLWYHVGSKNEKPGKTGFAHLFEHLMFEGSEHHPQDFTPWLESVGGDNNASTSEDRTNYFETLPSNQLERMLWLESDRMGFLPPAITQKSLDTQRDVVKNERRQRMDNEPYAKAYELTLSAIYPPNHPYSWPVIGSMEDLESASLQDVKDFFTEYYAPNNASLCIAGDFDPAQVKPWVEKYFGTLPSGQPIERVAQWIPQVDGVKRIHAEDRVELARFSVNWPSPAMYQPGDAELDLFANVLAGGKTSRLYKALVYDRQIAQDVSAYQNSNEINSVFTIDVTAKPGHSLDEIETAVNEIVGELLTKGFTKGELENAKTVYEAGYLRGLQMVHNIADALNEYNTFFGDPGRFQWDLDRYTNASAENVLAVARQYLKADAKVIVNIYPQGDYEAATASVDRTQMPAASTDPSFAPPTIQRAKLSNGMDLLLVEKHNLPLIQTSVVVKSGWAADPADKPGSASLTADMLDEGTKTRDALQISETAKSLGASLSTSSSFDGSFVGLNVIKKNYDKGLELMTDVLLNPAFADKDLERLRKNYLGRIMQEGREPTTSAFKTYYRLLFGAGHPYGQPQTGSGTESSIKAITRDDLVAYYKANFVANNAAVVVVGDITLDEAKAKLDKALAKWSTGAVAALTVPTPAPLAKTRIVIVDKKDAPQSVIVMGNVGIKRSDPDFLPTAVMNTVLGGQFTSRLNLNLREDKGYTYGAGSGFGARRFNGPFLAYSMVQTEVTDKAITEFVKELTGVGADKPLTQDELTAGKNNLIKGYPQNFETITSIAGQLGNMVLMELPPDEWTTYTSRVQAVDVAAATNAAKAHITPGQLLIVVVGDRTKIEDGLKKLNLGDVEVLNPEQLSTK